MGPIVGGTFVAMLPYYLETFADFSFILKGVVLIVVLMFAPAGVCDVIARPVLAWRRAKLERAVGHDAQLAAAVANDPPITLQAKSP